MSVQNRIACVANRTLNKYFMLGHVISINTNSLYFKLSIILQLQNQIMLLSNLDNCLFPGVEFTCRDEIAFDLFDIIKCPILLESSSSMVIFNLHFYDRDSFDSH